MDQTTAPMIDGFGAHRRLARSLDALPNRFPAADDGSDLRLLAKLYSAQEADLAADLRAVCEGPGEIAARLRREPRETASLLKEMARKGLIAMGKTAEGRLGFRLMPFVVGIYEAQIGRIDAELAGLFEAYYQKSFKHALEIQPQLHRVIPVGESIQNSMEVLPFESVSGLVDQMQAWGVLDCICRTQKALIGESCEHPVDVCMAFSTTPGAFDGGGVIRPLDREGALHTLKRASEAGLVHTVSNNQRDVWYICNCCTCSCAILRGMAELGIANVVARSAFVNQVDESLCMVCGECVEACSFDALKVDARAEVLETRCVGCGVCVKVCPQGALSLVRRAGESLPPLNEEAWGSARR